MSQHEDKLRKTEVRFAGAVAFFACVQVGVSYYQWDISRQALKMAERPWVIPKGITFDSLGNLTRKLSNSGQTPALSVRTGLQWRSFETDAPNWLASQASTIEADSNASKADLPAGIVFPGHEYNLTLLVKKEPALAEAIQRARQGEARMYLISCIEYVDAFEQKHTTTYCNYVERDSDILPFCTYGDRAT